MPTSTPAPSMPLKDATPYCGNCGYQLTGLTESAKCPECGKPLVEVLVRPQLPQTGRRYESAIRIFGLPLLHIALGPKGEEPRGRARGIIAVGDIATGLLAIGGVARGLVAIGGLAVGLVAEGGLAVGMVAAMGGLAIGGMAAGGAAVGLAAMGGAAAGVLATGGGAAGWFARGAGAAGTYVIDPRVGASPGADAVLADWAWLIGDNPQKPLLLLWILAAQFAVVILAAAVTLAGYWFAAKTQQPGSK